jgi:hypothetical protein
MRHPAERDQVMHALLAHAAERHWRAGFVSLLGHSLMPVGCALAVMIEHE